MDSERASSGRNAAIRFSLVEKKKFDTITSATASATAPGAAKYSPAVNSTQPAVAARSSRFFAACASAQAPTSGALSSTARYDTESAAVHANVAHGALPATAPTK